MPAMSRTDASGSITGGHAVSTPPACQQWFKFPAPSGPTITGVCKFCGVTQTVPTMGSPKASPKQSKFRTAVTLTEDDIERMRYAKAQANAAIAWLGRRLGV